MDACKLICYNMRGQNFVNAVAYLSVHITKIFPNAQIKNKKKRMLSVVKTGWSQGRGLGHGLWGSYRHVGYGGSGSGGSGWLGSGGDLDCPCDTWNGVDIRDIYWDFSSADWGPLQGGGQEYGSCQCSRVRSGGGRSNQGTFGGRDHGGGRQIS